MKIRIFVFTLGGLIFLTESSPAVEIRTGIDFYGGIKANKPVKTWKELRDEGVIFQRLDYSCGSAALATVFHHQKVVVNEREVIEYILKTGDLKKIIQRKGFSLLDLKRFVESQGYQAVGYKLDLESLAEFKAPLITPIVVHGYKHFVVVRGLRDGHVFLTDPARGRLTIPVGQFKDFWYTGNELGGESQGIGFVVLSKIGEAVEEGTLALKQEDQSYLDRQRLRALIKDRTFFVPPVPGEF